MEKLSCFFNKTLLSSKQTKTNVRIIMVFSIYEQGLRIKTPWESVFPPRNVQQTTEIAASKVVTENNLNKPQQQTGALKTYHQMEEKPQQRNRVYTAEQIMSTPVITLAPDMSLDAAWKHCQQYALKHFPVVNTRGKLLGVISKTNMLEATSALIHPRQTSHSFLQVNDTMRAQVLTASAETQVRQLAEVMNNYHIGSLPILDEQEMILGIVTRSDLMRTIMHQAPLELWT